jgi:hypothetical protein
MRTAKQPPTILYDLADQGASPPETMRIVLDHAPPSPPQVAEWLASRPLVFYAWAALAVTGVIVWGAVRCRVRGRTYVYKPASQ